MDPLYLWLMAGCAVLTALALWKPPMRWLWQTQRVVLLWLLIFALVSGSGHALARRFGHPEHAELGIWAFAALACLCLLGAVRDPFDIPGTRGAHMPQKTRRVLRAGLAMGGVVFLALGLHRDHRVVALYRRCEDLYAQARTPQARQAAGAQVLDPALKENAPSAYNPGPALRCRDVMEP